MPISSSTRRVLANLIPARESRSSLNTTSSPFSLSLSPWSVSTVGDEFGVETTSIVERRLVISISITMTEEKKFLLKKIQDDQSNDFSHVHPRDHLLETRNKTDDRIDRRESVYCSLTFVCLDWSMIDRLLRRISFADEWVDHYHRMHPILCWWSSVWT